MTDTSELELQLAPVAAVPREAREVVERAFNAAGARFRWIRLPGDRSRQGDLDPPRAFTLTVKINLEEESRTGASLEPFLLTTASALAAVRDQLPELPLGLELLAPNVRRFYSFGPKDDADAVSSAVMCIVEERSFVSGAMGWNAEKRKWMELTLFDGLP